MAPLAWQPLLSQAVHQSCLLLLLVVVWQAVLGHLRLLACQMLVFCCPCLLTDLQVQSSVPSLLWQHACHPGTGPTHLQAVSAWLHTGCLCSCRAVYACQSCLPAQMTAYHCCIGCDICLLLS